MCHGGGVGKLCENWIVSIEILSIIVGRVTQGTLRKSIHFFKVIINP